MRIPNQGTQSVCQLEEACHKEEVLHSHVMVLGLKATLFSSSGYTSPGFRSLQGTCLLFQRKCRLEMEICNWVQKYDTDMAEKQVCASSAVLSQEVTCSGGFLSTCTHGSYMGGCGSEGQLSIQKQHRLYVCPACVFRRFLLL